MEGVPFDLSDYLSSEGLSDIVPAGSGLHRDRAGQDGCQDKANREEPHYFGPRASLLVSDLDSSWNSSGSRMIQASDTAECPSIPMHEWHSPPLASQYEPHPADGLQGHDIAGCVHSDYAQNLAQVHPNNEPIANEDQYRMRSSASILEPLEAGINPLPSQQVLESAVSQTETNRDVSKLDPDELKVLLPEQACHCATCLFGYEIPHRFLDRDGAPTWTARTLSCRVTGCQWTTEAENPSRPSGNFRNLVYHERWGGREGHYGKPGKWRCREVGCKLVTKRWDDFVRHSTSKHCIKPKDLKCPFLECKYHHIDFSRKDKLKSHVDKIHKGTPHPGKPNQAIKSKVIGHA